MTGTQVLLLVVSETGLVYTFTTVKLQPIVTKPEGKNLIQACLNAPDPSEPSTVKKKKIIIFVFETYSFGIHSLGTRLIQTLHLK